MSHCPPGAIAYRPLHAEDHPQVQALWAQCEDVQPRLLAEPAAMARYLQRNPGCSWGAFAQGEVDALIGCVFAGHDGLRGSLHHLAVAPQARRQGIAQALVTASLQALAAVDITMTTVWIYDRNHAGNALWAQLGYSRWDSCSTWSRHGPPPQG